jgi:preprotein translocase subunit SecA
MAKAFPELRLCEHGWKADKIACEFYPSWRKNQLKKATEKAHDTIQLKEELGNITVLNADPTSPHKRKASQITEQIAKKAKFNATEAMDASITDKTDQENADPDSDNTLASSADNANTGFDTTARGDPVATRRNPLYANHFSPCRVA